MTAREEAEQAWQSLSKDSDAAIKEFDELLLHNPEARRLLPLWCEQDLRRVYNLCLAAGRQATIVFATTLLVNNGWTSSQSRSQAAVNTSELCLATLRSSDDDDKHQYALGLLVRLSSTPATGVQLEMSSAIMELLIAQLDFRRSQAVQSQALLVIMRCLESTSGDRNDLIRSILLKKGSSNMEDDIVVAFSATAALFPVVTQLCTELFTAQPVIRKITACLKKSAGMVSDGDSQPSVLRNAALLLSSASCVDKTCREAIKKTCTTELTDLVDDHDPNCATTAMLVMAKTGGGQALCRRLISVAIEDTDNCSIALEALAYVSMSPAAKEAILGSSLLSHIVQRLSKQDDSLLSCMTILVNLSAFRTRQSKEQEKVAELKAYAEANKPQANSGLENDGVVMTRCQKLIDASVVPAVVRCCKSSQSPAILSLVAQLLHALARLTKQRARMTQEGAIGALLRIREVLSRTEPSISNLTAAHALARILISVNPAHAFIGPVTAAACIGMLSPLLSPSVDDNGRDWLPTFECLLALTNIASLDDPARSLIVSKCWSTLENDLILLGNTLVQRASVELVCNLMQCPAGAAKFADDSDAAGRRLYILLVLTDAEDKPTRSAAGGALAMLTEWDGVAARLMKQSKAIPLLLKLATDADDDMKHRGLVCLMNLVNTPGEEGTQARSAIAASNGQDAIRTLMSAMTDDDLINITKDILKQIP